MNFFSMSREGKLTGKMITELLDELKEHWSCLQLLDINNSQQFSEILLFFFVDKNDENFNEEQKCKINMVRLCNTDWRYLVFSLSGQSARIGFGLINEYWSLVWNNFNVKTN